MNELTVVDLGSSSVVLRRARVYERLGFARSHEGMKLAL
jgi:hypothetical protein